MNDEQRAKARAAGLAYYYRNRAKRLDAMRNRTPELRRRYRLKADYGLEDDAHQVLIARSGGRCEICSKQPPAGQNLSVDHDHKTGKVRGLLCRSCNSLLDVATATWLTSARSYLALTFA